MTSLVVRKVRSGGVTKLKLVPVVQRTISEGVLKLERVQVICPACGQQGEAVARDGRVKGYCAVAKQDVNFLIKTRTNHSAIAKKLWQDPEFRAKQVASHTGKRYTTEHRARISAGVKRHNVIAKQNVSFLIETQLERENAVSQTRSIASKKLWEDPDYRAKQSVARKEQHQNAEYQIKLSTAAKKLWQDPDYRAKQSATMKKLWQDLEYRAKQSATHTGKHHTAETKAKISAGAKRHNKMAKS